MLARLLEVALLATLLHGCAHAPADHRAASPEDRPARPLAVAPATTADETVACIGLHCQLSDPFRHADYLLMAAGGAEIGVLGWSLSYDCLRFGRYRVEDLSLILQTGCIGLKNPSDLSLVHTGSGWLIASTASSGPATERYDFSIYRTLDGGSQVAVADAIQARDPEQRTISSGTALLRPRPGGATAIYTDGLATRVVLVDPEGKTQGKPVELSPSVPRIDAAVPLRGGVLLLRHRSLTVSGGVLEGSYFVTHVDEGGKAVDVDVPLPSGGSLFGGEGGAGLLGAVGEGFQLLRFDLGSVPAGPPVLVPLPSRFQVKTGLVFASETWVLGVSGRSPVLFHRIARDGQLLETRELTPVSADVNLQAFLALADGHPAVAWTPRASHTMRRFVLGKLTRPTGTTIAAP